MSLLLDLAKQPFQRLPTPQSTPKSNEFLNRSALVTGANTGLGLETARHLLLLGVSTLVLCVRDITKGEAAKEDLLNTPGLINATKNVTVPLADRIQIWNLDQSKFSSVKAFCTRVVQEFGGDVKTLDYVFLNAGLARTDYHVTEDGWESTIQVNVLATAYISFLLLPTMIRQSLANASAGFTPRLVMVASGTHAVSPFNERLAPQGKILTTLSSEENFRSLVTGKLYETSKLLNVYTCQRIVSVIPDHPANALPSVIVTSVDPGLCHSSLAREGMPFPFGLIKWLFARTPEVGSRNIVWGALVDGPKAQGGYIANCRITPPQGKAADRDGIEAGDRTWVEILDVLKAVDPSLTAIIEKK